MRNTWRFPTLALSLTVALVIGACSSSDTTETPVTAVAMSPSGNAAFTGTVGAAIGAPPSVLVTGSDGQPFAGATVTFAVTGGGGTVTGGTATSNASGIATAGGWTLGQTAGSNTMTATSGALSAVSFTAAGSPGAPATATIVSGNTQSAVVGGAVPAALTVRVNDQYSNAVPNANVTFAVATGGGQAIGGAATTNAQGQASAGWILGSNTGSQTMTATAGSAPAVTFTATATAAAASRLAVASGNSQAGNLNVALGAPLSVIATDAFNNPVANVPIAFAVSSGAGTLSTGTGNTNAQGLATTNLTLTAVGVSTVTATSSAITGSAAVFNANTGPTLVGQVSIPSGSATPFTSPASADAVMRGFSRRPNLAAKGGMSGVAVVMPNELTPEEVSQRMVTRGRIVVSYKPEAFGLPESARAYGAAAVRQNAVSAYLSAIQPYVADGLVETRALSPAIGALLVQAAPGRDINEVMATLRQDPRVQAVEEDGVMYATHMGGIVADAPPPLAAPAFLDPLLAPPIPLAFVTQYLSATAFAAPATEVHPSDPLLYQQLWHYRQIDLPRAWKLTTGNKQTRVAIIDTGLRPEHPALTGQLSTAQDHFDFTDGVTNAFGAAQPICGGGSFTTVRGTSAELALPRNAAQDPLQLVVLSSAPTCWTRGNGHSHGTHVAATIASAANDGIGGIGVSWDPTLMVIRVLGVTGSGFTFDVAQGILYAAGLPATYTGAPIGFTVTPTAAAHIANMSLGGGTASAVRDNAVSAATSAGLLIFAAAGNSSGSALGSHPAANPLVVTIAALDPLQRPAWYTNSGSPVDLAFPGGSSTSGPTSLVLSATWNYQLGQANYSFYQGTSMATPHAVGVAALIKAMNPSFTAAQIRQRMESTADDIGPVGRDDWYGHGLGNAYRALTNSAGPASNTEIRLVNATTGVVARTQNLGSDRRFTFANVPAGDYYVVASQDEGTDGTHGVPGRRFNWFGSSPMAIVNISGSTVRHLGLTMSAPIEGEPNDDQTVAQPMVVNGWVAGNLSGTDVSDIFSFVVPTAGTYTLETSGALGSCGVGVDVDTILRLLNQSGALLAEDDDTPFASSATPTGTASYPGEMCSKISMTLQPGKYFAQVMPFSGTTGTYRLHIRSGS